MSVSKSCLALETDIYLLGYDPDIYSCISNLISISQVLIVGYVLEIVEAPIP